MAQHAGTAVTESGQNETLPQSHFTRIFFLVWALWIILAGVFGYWVGSNRTALPSDGAAEVGFARDMITHHANAVELTMIIIDQTEDGDLRFLARDMMLTQQAQIGQMQGWLQVWGLPIASVAPHMAWMGMPMEGLMPGMASTEALDRLGGLHGTEADILFLNLMIAHHQSGVDMARAVLQSTNRPEVTALANAIVVSQENEISLMREMLQQKGGVESQPIR